MMVTKEEIAIDNFCDVLEVVLEKYEYAQTSQNKVLEKFLYWMINKTVRQAGDFFPVSGASKAAQEVADEMGIGLLVNYRWNQQKTKMKDPERTIFILEHKETVYEIVKRILKGDEPIKDILNSYCLVWLLKEEDRRLNDLGYKSRRPDSDKAYEECYIEILGVSNE